MTSDAPSPRPDLPPLKEHTMKLFGSKPSAFEQRETLIAERAALAAELSALATQHGQLGSDFSDALATLNGQLARWQRETHGRNLPEPGSIAALRRELEELRSKRDHAETRLPEIRQRMAEIVATLSRPLELTKADIQGHLKALAAATECADKLCKLVDDQTDKLAALRAETDEPHRLAVERGDLLAAIATGERPESDLSAFDQAATKAATEAMAKALAATEGEALLHGLQRKLTEAESALAELKTRSIEIRAVILATELESAAKAHDAAHRAEIAARAKRTGLAELLKACGKAIDHAELLDPVAPWQAARIEQERLASAGFASLF